MIFGSSENQCEIFIGIGHNYCYFCLFTWHFGHLVYL